MEMCVRLIALVVRPDKFTGQWIECSAPIVYCVADERRKIRKDFLSYADDPNRRVRGEPLSDLEIAWRASRKIADLKARRNGRIHTGVFRGAASAGAATVNKASLSARAALLAGPAAPAAPCQIPLPFRRACWRGTLWFG